MFYDLNVPWTDNHGELQRTVAFLDELGYDIVALTHTFSGRLPADLVGPQRSPLINVSTLHLFSHAQVWPTPSRGGCAPTRPDWLIGLTVPPQTPPIPLPLPFTIPSRLRILRRCNLFLTDAASNHRIPQLQQHYDLIAARPTDERTLQQACASLDVDIISLDMTQKFETHFKFPMLGSAISRGIKFEMCYSQGLLSSDPNAKRNLISNATQLIRVTRGRGLILSSEARNALGIRSPSDVINLASVWGLGHERGKDGLTKETRSVVEFARLKRTSFRGAVDVVYGGEKPAVPEQTAKAKQKGQKQQNNQNKRKADSMEGTPTSQKSSSKKQQRNQKPRPKAQQEPAAEKQVDQDNQA
ncbi:PHP domain-like protein [Polyplosphaeria fusca]|uniref:PHP domain-like protein n=1 Tax=Polyplosphaeria fusca TaxID=682080 RepID=A0A9P4V4A1_9PLEO|nr:PHP domain-like protein [Polyplosphaeria fusca]